MNTIENITVRDTLRELHRQSEEDYSSRMQKKKEAERSGLSYEKDWGTAFMSVSQQEGRFLHFMAKAVHAKNIVEFGCSFGISTIYLAAVAKDNGGKVTTTDIEPNKISGAQRNISQAGLSEYVEFLLGDATQTLRGIEGPIDFLFLDGAKDLYLPVFELLHHRLDENAIVLADNADKAEAAPFVEAVRAFKEEFTHVTLFEGRIFLATRNKNRTTE